MHLGALWEPLQGVCMRNGYILLHRKGITKAEWKHPRRTLAWIDFCTMAAYQDYVADDEVKMRRGEVVTSYGFLAKRWRISKGTVHFWMQHWITERRVERLTERCEQRKAERFFIVNYAKYQQSTERLLETTTERLTERSAERMKVKEEKQKKKKASAEKIFEDFYKKSMELNFADEGYAEKTIRQAKSVTSEDREEVLRKMRVFLNCCKCEHLHSKARILFSEIAGFVNDKGDMQRQLSVQEQYEREQFIENQFDNV